MQDLRADLFYEILDGYDRLAIDYCLIKDECSYEGYSSHREAVLYAMEQLKESYPWITIDSDKATAEKITSDDLFFFPEGPWKENAHGTVLYHDSYINGGKIPYWYAFLEPPHGTGPVIKDGKIIRKNYGSEDFELINRSLFPMGTDEIEIYEWSTDWSNYFDAGHEWWGTLCCSVYDKTLGRYAVIMASESD